MTLAHCSALQGCYESAPQLFLQLVLVMSNHTGFYQTSSEDYYGIASSLLLLCKDLTENILSKVRI